MARNLGVDISTVYRTLQLFHTTGSVTKKQYPKERAYRKLTPPFELFILNKVIEKPGVFLKEVQEALQDELYKFLHKSGFT